MSRDELLIVVRDFVIQALDGGDFGDSALDPEGVAAAERLAEVIEPDDNAWYLIGMLYWVRFSAPQGSNDMSDLEAAIAAFTHVYAVDPEEVPEPLRAAVADAAGMGAGPADGPHAWHDQAVEILQGMEMAGVLDPAALDEAVDLLRRTVQALAEDDPDRAVVFSNLGLALNSRFALAEDPADLDEAVAAAQVSVDAGGPRGASMAARLANFATVLRARFEYAGDGADLDRATSLSRAAVDVLPEGDPSESAFWFNLGLTLQLKAEHTGDDVDLDQAIHAFQAGMDSPPVASLSPANLGVLLHRRFERTGASTDLHRAVNAFQAAVDRTPEGDPARTRHLFSLGFTARVAFGHDGRPADLDLAVAALQNAVDSAADDHLSLSFIPWSSDSSSA